MAQCAVFSYACLCSFSNAAQRWPWLPAPVVLPIRRKMGAPTSYRGQRGLMYDSLEQLLWHFCAVWEPSFEAFNALKYAHQPPLLRYNQKVEIVCCQTFSTGVFPMLFYQMVERGQHHFHSIFFFFSFLPFSSFHVSFLSFLYLRILSNESEVSYTKQCGLEHQGKNYLGWNQICMFEISSGWFLDWFCEYGHFDVLWTIWRYVSQSSSCLRKASCTDNSAEVSHACHKNCCSRNWKIKEIAADSVRNVLLLVLEMNFKQNKAVLYTFCLLSHDIVSWINPRKYS